MTVGRPLVPTPDACIVVPWLDWDRAHATIQSMCPRVAAGTMLIDNRRGGSVAGAWNRGRAVVVAGDPWGEWFPSWLVLCSTATTFGVDGGLDLLAALHAEDGSRQVSVTGAGWHLHAIPRSVLVRVGPFDDGFAPAYCEDSDYIYRTMLAGLGNMYAGEGHVHVEVDATWLGDGHSIRSGLVDPSIPGRSLDMYRTKWGGKQGEETYATPFNRADVDWTWLWRDEALARGWTMTEVSRWGSTHGA